MPSTRALITVLVVVCGCDRVVPVVDAGAVATVDSGVVVDVDHDAVGAELEPFERALRPIVKKRFDDGSRVDSGDDPIAVAVGWDQHAAFPVALLGSGFLARIGGGTATTQPHPSALAASSSRAWVASSVSGELQRFDITEKTPRLLGASNVDVKGVSALAVYGDSVAVAGIDGEVIVVDGRGVEVSRCDGGLGIVSLLRTRHFLIAASSLQHTITIWPFRDRARCGEPEVLRFKGPVFRAIAQDIPPNDDVDDTVDTKRVELHISGVEDEDLDRSGGGFGNVDSFLYGYRYTPETGWRRRYELNLSEQGVVVGRALAFDGRHVVVAGRGSGVLLTLGGELLLEHPRNVGAGVVDIAVAGATVYAANPIDDVVVAGDKVVQLRKRPDALARLGERLVFTNLMAPQQTSTGTASRFTCETCHLDGGVDGRVHKTGRVDDEGHAITATTKPLFGLFQNPPLFSRALDRTVSLMVHAEFKVANKNTPQAPWFGVDVDGVHHEPAELRKAMIAFFASLDPPPNARAFGRTAFNDDERAGFAVFQKRCISCHAARVFADDAGSDVVSDVEAAVFTGAVVFARDGHEDTGVRPLVHPQGARPSSLRGISRKTPLLTNGHARDLAGLLQLVRVDGTRFFHESPTGTALTKQEQEALLAFLRLL